MNSNEISAALKAQFIDAELEWVEPENGDRFLYVPALQIPQIVKHLKESPEFYFDYLVNLSAFDATAHIEVVYHFYSYKHRHTFVLKVKVARENGEIPTIVDLYGAANFQEREVYDHFGVRFKGHPNLTRILLPQDWVGYPLLKDYKEQAEYNGIETTRPQLLDFFAPQKDGGA